MLQWKCEISCFRNPAFTAMCIGPSFDWQWCQTAYVPLVTDAHRAHDRQAVLAGTATLSPARATTTFSSIRDYALLLFPPGLPVLSRPSLEVSGYKLFDLSVFVVCRHKAGLGQQELPSWWTAQDSEKLSRLQSRLNTRGTLAHRVDGAPSRDEYMGRRIWGKVSLLLRLGGLRERRKLIQRDSG